MCVFLYLTISYLPDPPGFLGVFGIFPASQEIHSWGIGSGRPEAGTAGTWIPTPRYADHAWLRRCDEPSK